MRLTYFFAPPLRPHERPSGGLPSSSRSRSCRRPPGVLAGDEERGARAMADYGHREARAADGLAICSFNVTFCFVLLSPLLLHGVEEREGRLSDAR